MVRSAEGAMAATFTDPARLAAAPAGACPFSDATPDETALAARLFPDAAQSDDKLGRFEAAYAGHAVEGAYRQAGSSGGLTTWLAANLMEQGLIDGVVHVHARTGPDATALFAYALSRTADEVRAGAKTRYYSVQFADALGAAVAEDRRIALIGVPCFITAARHLAARDPKLAQALRYTISLVCGHMKAEGFAESLAWQSGTRPDRIETVDFRAKLAGRRANDYGFATQERGQAAAHVVPMAQLAGRRWDGGFFKLKACEFCDDVVGETADVAMGDAWLPAYTRDDKGTNLVIVRHPALRDMLEAAAQDGRIALDPITPEQAAQSQDAGFRDRREALRYRLYLAEKRGGWHPRKRVAPARDHITAIRRLTYRWRQWVRRRSFASYRFSKRIGLIAPYRAEMTFHHACLKGLGMAEKALKRVG